MCRSNCLKGELGFSPSSLASSRHLFFLDLDLTGRRIPSPRFPSKGAARDLVEITRDKISHPEQPVAHMMGLGSAGPAGRRCLAQSCFCWALCHPGGSYIRHVTAACPSLLGQFAGHRVSWPEPSSISGRQKVQLKGSHWEDIRLLHWREQTQRLLEGKLF